jgi:hypothetical protein
MDFSFECGLRPRSLVASPAVDEEDPEVVLAFGRISHWAVYRLSNDVAARFP